ncbi:hypothetical protein CDL15_Pgr028480 [Punica granatum]|uniref:Uncharacterized protein n=1 Tax=Punica granatum TaxID=22663 RepID=A0A218VWQ4_PUNGR|nr:hypothetical protein CDL15_Pgr028480 [Punica granatum]PKI51199.1 hypothetical protein CRG98_028406 [Punica granatum]
MATPTVRLSSHCLVPFSKDPLRIFWPLPYPFLVQYPPGGKKDAPTVTVKMKPTMLKSSLMRLLSSSLLTVSALAAC